MVRHSGLVEQAGLTGAVSGLRQDSLEVSLPGEEVFRGR